MQIANQMSRSSRHLSDGLTLVEIIVVISIIIIVTLSAVWAFSNAFQRGQASQLAADFRTIESAWQSYLVDTDGRAPLDSAFGTGANPDAPCHSDPVLSETDLFSDVTGKANWNGPYLDSARSDPWGVRYAYDNDGDVYSITGGGNRAAGVNIAVQWCTAGSGNVPVGQYIKTAPFIDRALDDANGPDAGIFRWDDTPEGSFYFLLSPS